MSEKEKVNDFLYKLADLFEIYGYTLELDTDTLDNYGSEYVYGATLLNKSREVVCYFDFTTITPENVREMIKE